MKSALRRSTALLVFLLILGLGSACDSANPVAPSGTSLSITANPSRIDANGTAQIRVIARKPNGNPVNPGTLITMATTLGNIPGNVPTDDLGEAIATLRGTGQEGMATVSASTGSSETVTVDVQIGLGAGNISLNANPSSVPETGGTVELLAIVRDEQGQPLANAAVNFLTTVGQLASGGRVVLTASDGSASDTLTVTASDVDTLGGDTFPVSAEVGSSGALLTADAIVFIQRLPRADFTFGVSNLTAVFTDTSTGRPTSWTWDFGDGSTSRLQNPSHTYASPGTYTVTLTIRNSLGEDTISKFVAVTGQ
jgi:hypothetical protein